MIRRLSPLLLAMVATAAQAADGLPNPFTMLVPMASPMTSPMPNPLAGYGSPYGGGFGSPFGGGYGNPFAPGYGNPLGSLGTLNTLSTLASLGIVAAPLVAPLAPGLLGGPVGQIGYPAMQMAPNMMSYSHYNQYGGGVFGGNPYLQRSLPNPLVPPAFSPSMPTMPFTPSQGTLPLPFGAPAAAPAPMAPPMLPATGLGAPAVNPLALLPLLTGPSMAPPPGLVPGLAPAMPMAPAGQGNPWAQSQDVPVKPAPKAAAQPLANPWMAMPVLTPAAPAPSEPVAQPKPAPAPTAAPAADPAAMPADPAAFLQMLMKPIEGAAKAAGTPPAK